MYTPDRNYGCRISDKWRLHDMRVVVMENELLRVSILADKGSDIFEFLYKPMDIDFMWRSPTGIRNPNLGLPTNTTENGHFLDYYGGGWQEILPSGGAASTYKGVTYGQHGEASNLPWEARVTEDEAEQVSCELNVRLLRTPLRVVKSLTLKRNQPKLFISERLINESPEDVDLMWGHHLAFGEPFLNKHCRLDCEATKIVIHPDAYSENHRFLPGDQHEWPNAKTHNGDSVDFHQIPPASIKSEDMTYLLDLKAPWFALTDTQRRVGFGLRWDGTLFRYLWYWQVFGGGSGYPWYGRTYNIGLEPWTSMPTSGLAEAVKAGTHLTIPANHTIKCELQAIAYTGRDAVTKIDPECVVK